jgi:hypothetical protein
MMARLKVEAMLTVPWPVRVFSHRSSATTHTVDQRVRFCHSKAWIRIDPPTSEMPARATMTAMYAWTCFVSDKEPDPREIGSCSTPGVYRLAGK